MITNRHLRGPVAGTALALVLATASGTAGSWPGDPDGTYGGCGVRRIDVVAGAPSTLRAASGASAGAVLAAGAANGGGLVMRLTKGAPDPTFGTGGWTRISYGPADARYDAVDATAGGGAVAVGRRITTAGVSDSVILVLAPNGKPDTTFRSTGRLIVNAGGTDAAT